MANDRWYNPGDYYQLDDISGFKIRASRSRRIPGGQTGNAIVAPERWEPQQPQDFVRGIPDIQTVPQPRPRQENRFTVLGTNIAAPSARGATFITVESSVGFGAGMRVRIMLDQGVNFDTSLASVPDRFTMELETGLPGTVGTMFGDPIENLVLSLSSNGALTFVLDQGGSNILDYNVLA